MCPQRMGKLNLASAPTDATLDRPGRKMIRKWGKNIPHSISHFLKNCTAPTLDSFWAVISPQIRGSSQREEPGKLECEERQRDMGEKIGERKGEEEVQSGEGRWINKDFAGNRMRREAQRKPTCQQLVITRQSSAHRPVQGLTKQGSGGRNSILKKK